MTTHRKKAHIAGAGLYKRYGNLLMPTWCSNCKGLTLRTLRKKSCSECGRN